MLNNKRLSTGRFIFWGLTLVLLDQIVKLVIISQFASIMLINTGLILDLGARSPLLVSVAIIILFVVTLAIVNRPKLLTLSVLLIVSGGLSNIIDRLLRSGVVDYINVRFWPTFNIADIMICAGLVVLVLDLARKS